MTDTPRPDTSAGALLRAARERQGLHIAALAAAIKVAPRKLDALENDRWDDLPDATFTRALAQTVCRTLKVDPRPVLDLLPPVEAVLLEQVGTPINASFGGGGAGEGPGWAAAIRPMVAAGVLLLVAAAVVWWWPAGWWPAAPVPAAETAAPPVAAPAPPAESPAASAAEPPAVPASAASAVAPAQAATDSAAPPPDPAVPAAVAAAVSETALALRATQSSWVEVRDAGGRVLLSRVVVAGENLTLAGTEPLRLTIGNAAGTELAYRGSRIDLAPYARDNVARLELPPTGGAAR